MHEMWLERWQEGRTGWHEDTGNESLMRHWRVTGRRVLVPLCGKTPDMRWLADHGNQVIQFKELFWIGIFWGLRLVGVYNTPLKITRL